MSELISKIPSNRLQYFHKNLSLYRIVTEFFMLQLAFSSTTDVCYWLQTLLSSSIFIMQYLCPLQFSLTTSISTILLHPTKRFLSFSHSSLPVLLIPSNFVFLLHQQWHPQSIRRQNFHKQQFMYLKTLFALPTFQQIAPCFSLSLSLSCLFTQYCLLLHPRSLSIPLCSTLKMPLKFPSESQDYP